MDKYPVILFWPEPNKAVPKSRIYRICDEYGVEFHNNPKKHYDLHFFWSYCLNHINPDMFTLTDSNVINRGCWDISKEKVNAIFNDFSVDPETHIGICVEKADKQGVHGLHRVIKCPAPRKEGYVYQRYIDDMDGNLYIKYRVYYADGIEYILKSKKKSIFGTYPFNTDYVSHEWVGVRKVFTENEQADFDRKCAIFGFNYGDIDVMMENGKPIIVDVNNIVSSEPFTQWIKDVQDKQFLSYIQRKI